jgi:hypothetical protein
VRTILTGAPSRDVAMLEDFTAFQNAWSQSVSADPDWHAAWLSDVVNKAKQLGPSLLMQENPRVRGLSVS